MWLPMTYIYIYCIYPCVYCLTSQRGSASFGRLMVYKYFSTFRRSSDPVMLSVLCEADLWCAAHMFCVTCFERKSYPLPYSRNDIWRKGIDKWRRPEHFAEVSSAAHKIGKIPSRYVSLWECVRAAFHQDVLHTSMAITRETKRSKLCYSTTRLNNL